MSCILSWGKLLPILWYADKGILKTNVIVAVAHSVGFIVIMAQYVQLATQKLNYCLSRDDTAQKDNIHQVTTMLATSKNALFQGHNLLLTTSIDDLTLSR